MKLPVVNRGLAKQAIIKYLREQLQIDIPFQVSDYDLDKVVVENRKRINWECIAQQYLSGIYTKIQLFHYYYESFQRSLYNDFTLEDMLILEDEIVYRIKNKIPLDLDQQQIIKQQLSQAYHRTTFNLLFHNTKRRLMKEIQQNTYIPYKYFIDWWNKKHSERKHKQQSEQKVQKHQFDDLYNKIPIKNTVSPSKEDDDLNDYQIIPSLDYQTEDEWAYFTLQ